MDWEPKRVTSHLAIYRSCLLTLWWSGLLNSLLFYELCWIQRELANDDFSASTQLISAEENKIWDFWLPKLSACTSGHTGHGCWNSLHTEAQENTTKSWLLNPHSPPPYKKKKNAQSKWKWGKSWAQWLWNSVMENDSDSAEIVTDGTIQGRH